MGIYGDIRPTLTQGGVHIGSCGFEGRGRSGGDVRARHSDKGKDTALVGCWRRLRVPAIYTVVVASLVAAISAGVLVGKVYSAADKVDAIVLVASSDVRSGPGETNPQLVEVHEGLKVTVLGSREGWL